MVNRAEFGCQFTVRRRHGNTVWGISFFYLSALRETHTHPHTHQMARQTHLMLGAGMCTHTHTQSSTASHTQTHTKIGRQTHTNVEGRHVHGHTHCQARTPTPTHTHSPSLPIHSLIFESDPSTQTNWLRMTPQNFQYFLRPPPLPSRFPVCDNETENTAMVSHCRAAGRQKVSGRIGQRPHEEDRTNRGAAKSR